MFKKCIKSITAVLLVLTLCGCTGFYGFFNSPTTTTAQTTETIPKTDIIAKTDAPVPETTAYIPPETTAETTVAVTEPEAPPADPYEGKTLIAITFDDGPNAISERILDIVENNEDKGVKVTFFVVGYNARAYKSVMKRADDDGCEIGIHGNTHLKQDSYDRLDVESIKADISAVDETINEAIGHYAAAVRPPFGAIQKDKASEIEKYFVNWSVDPKDWKYRDADTVANHIIDKAKDGDIVLMHSLTQSSVDAFEKVVEALSEKNYAFLTVTELLSRKFELTDGIIYYSAK